jgi:hypothetical protein
MKYGNLALEIKNIWKLNNVSIYPLDISEEGVVTKHLLQYLENTDLTKNISRVRKKAALSQTFHTVCKFLGQAP